MRFLAKFFRENGAIHGVHADRFFRAYFFSDEISREYGRPHAYLFFPEYTFLAIFFRDNGDFYADTILRHYAFPCFFPEKTGAFMGIGVQKKSVFPGSYGQHSPGKTDALIGFDVQKKSIFPGSSFLSLFVPFFCRFFLCIVFQTLLKVLRDSMVAQLPPAQVMSSYGGTSTSLKNVTLSCAERLPMNSP